MLKDSECRAFAAELLLDYYCSQIPGMPRIAEMPEGQRQGILARVVLE